MTQKELDTRLEKVAAIYDAIGEGKRAKDARERIGKPAGKYFNLEGYERIADSYKKKNYIQKNIKLEPYEIQELSREQYWQIFQSSRKRKFDIHFFTKNELEIFETSRRIYNRLNQLKGIYGYSDQDLKWAKSALNQIPETMGRVGGGTERYYAKLYAKKKGYKRGSPEEVEKAKRYIETIFMEATKILEKTEPKRDALKLELRTDFYIEKGDYLRRGEEAQVIEIKKIAMRSGGNFGDEKYVSYRLHDLERLTTYEVEDRQEYWMINNYKRAEKITKAEFSKLKKAASEPLPEATQKDLLNKINTEIKNQNGDLVRLLLRDYFNKVVLREPKKVATYFELRYKIPYKKHRPCICPEDYDEQTLANFYNKLPDNIWNLIPKNLIAKPKKISSRKDYQADPEDKHLKNLVGPFVGKDTFQLSMMGVHFDEKGITATNARLLLFLPKIKEGKKGTYCMTSRCFKENQTAEITDRAFPNYLGVLPKLKTKYTTFLLDVHQQRTLIQTLDKNGFEGNIINYLYGKENYVAVHSKTILQPGLEAMAKLGYEKARLWIESPNKAMVLTAPEVTKKQLVEKSVPLMLLMPFYRGENWKEFQSVLKPGDVLYDLEKNELRFFGNEKPAVRFGGGEYDKERKLKLAKAKAAAQKQRIRILYIMNN